MMWQDACMFDWLRKREREENQLEKIVDDIESPADPRLAGDEGLAPNAKNAVWAITIAAIILVIVAAILILVRPAAAGTNTQQRGEWFSSLRTLSGRSCCELGDCHRTDATLQADGSWTAMVDGNWRRIPPEKVLKAPLSIDGDAYVCNGKPWAGSKQVNGAIVSAPTSAGAIYCFVPPIPGY